MATVAEQAPAWKMRLHLPSYPVSEAARYVGVHRNTVTAWINNLPERAKGTPLSYLELVEMAFVASFRRLEVPFERIRGVRMFLGLGAGSDCPFATRAFKTEGCRALMAFRGYSSSKAWNGVIVSDSHGRSAWTELMRERFAAFDYEHEIAIRWHLAGRDSQVAIDPRIAFGAPMVSGLPTRILLGRFDSGETVPEIADDFDIDETAVRDALAFENRQVG